MSSSFEIRGNSLYTIVDGPTWEEAEANANKLGGHLVTINDADEIFVLEKGKILDRGSHETLISRSGIYKNLYEIQFKVESDDKKIH